MGRADGERHLRTHRPVRRVTGRIVGAALVVGLFVCLGLAMRVLSPLPPDSAADPLPSQAPTTVASWPSPSSRRQATPAASPLVATATWVTRSGVRAAKVVPTDAGRATAVDADEVWAQLVATLPDADTPGMRDQLVCHVHFAASKPAWYLEPARPAVGYAATVAAGCNPGSVRDAG